MSTRTHLVPHPTPTPAGPSDRPGRGVGAVMLGLVLGVSLAALDMTIVATAVRTIADDLGGLSLQAWATTAYLITGAISTPLYGRLSDLHGRKPLFLVAIGLFAVGSAACAAAQSMPQLAVLRAVQGLGAGGLFSLSVTIVGDVVAPRQRARYTGYLIAVYGVFGVLGPVVGGLLADADQILGITGWRWVFLVNVPVGAVALLVVAAVLRTPPRRPGRARVDWLGAAVLAAGLVPLLVVADEGRGWGWLSGPSLACYAAGLAGLAGFVLVERRMGEDALLPLRLFGSAVFARACAAGLVVGFGMFGAITVLPLYLQVVGGASPSEAGVLMLPLVAGIVAATAVSGRVIERTGRYRLWAVLGCGAMLVGFLWLSAVDTDTSFPAAAVCMAVFGLGIGGNLQSITLTVQDALPPADAGLATASTAFSRQLGGSVGASVFLSVLFGVLPERITAAFTEAAPRLAATLADPAVLAGPANRQLAEGLRAGGGDAVGAAVLEDSSFLGALHPDLARPFRDGFSAAMDVTFAVGALVMVLGLAAAFALPDSRPRSAPAPEGATAEASG